MAHMAIEMGQFDIHGGLMVVLRSGRLEEWRMSGKDMTHHLCEKCYEIVFTGETNEDFPAGIRYF